MKEKILLMYSGGLDSILSMVKLIYSGYKVLLVHFDNCCTISIGDEVKKGDPLGYFLFGGSDIVVIFEKNVELKLIGKINEHILMGENYAELKLK